jgi:hypothetical protein
MSWPIKAKNSEKEICFRNFYKMRVAHHIYYNFSQNKVIGPELFGNPELLR